MTFNRPNNQHSLTDKKTWRIAMLNNGEIAKIENPSDLSHVSDKMASGKSKSSNPISPIQMLK